MGEKSLTQRLYAATHGTNRGEIEYQVQREANRAFGKLISDNRFIFDPGQKRLTYRSMLVSQSTTPNLPAIAIGVEMSSNSPIPKLRAEIRIPKLEGAIGAFRYIALDNKLMVEITPKPQPPVRISCAYAATELGVHTMFVLLPHLSDQ